MSNPYMYLFVREDLSKPQQIIQTAHAVDEMNKKLDVFTDRTNHMVLIGAKNDLELYEIAHYLHMNKVEHFLFYEPDIEGHTAIATKPLVGKQREVMRCFSTMK